MTDNKTKEENAHEREQMIRGMNMDDLSKLTLTQMQMVQQVQLKRLNENAKKRVEESLKEKTEDVAASLTAAPFVYVGPEIKVMAGCKVRFSSMMNAQLRDAHTQLDDFIKKEDPNEIRTTDFLNRSLLAHSLVSYNDEDFGGVVLEAGDYQSLRQNDKAKADEMMAEVRNKRLLAIDDLSPHIVQRLIEYYQAFQLAMESMTKGEEMEEALGN